MMFERSPDVQETLDKSKKATKNMLFGATISGATGATIGAVLAVLRHESIKFYAASMGSNFFLLSSTYIGENAVKDRLSLVLT